MKQAFCTFGGLYVFIALLQYFDFVTLVMLSVVGFILFRHIQNTIQVMYSTKDSSEDEPAEQTTRKPKTKVKKFSKQAVLGVPVQVISLDSSSKASGTYTMDKSLRRLTIQATGGGKHTFLLAQATCFRGDESSLSTHQAVKSLGDKALVCVVHIQVSDEKAKTDHLILLADTLEADTFLTCMKVLKLYGQTVSPRP